MTNKDRAERLWRHARYMAALRANRLGIRDLDEWERFVETHARTIYRRLAEASWHEGRRAGWPFDVQEVSAGPDWPPPDGGKKRNPWPDPARGVKHWDWPERVTIRADSGEEEAPPPREKTQRKKPKKTREPRPQARSPRDRAFPAARPAPDEEMTPDGYAIRHVGNATVYLRWRDGGETTFAGKRVESPLGYEGKIEGDGASFDFCNMLTVLGNFNFMSRHELDSAARDAIVSLKNTVENWNTGGWDLWWSYGTLTDAEKILAAAGVRMNPASVVKTPRDERLWQEAKKIVSREYKVKKGSDQYWALVNRIFHRMKRRVGGGTYSVVRHNQQMIEVSERLAAQYRTFHGVDPDRVITVPPTQLPIRLKLLGKGIDVGYGILDERSSKSDWYVHPLGKGVKIYRLAKKGERADKVFKKFPQNLTVLGYNIGLTYQRDPYRGLTEVKGDENRYLTTPPDKKRLVVVGPQGNVLYFIAGGKLHVSDWIRN